ncbi:DMT family transporter [Thiolinea disciformis]|uniref:DMT family transporter n=1 Tax=Thiolinea disciformis TaxID=125614 RepID=UPI00035E8DDC|nr:DMT family transporter [Thiolinea disciformis]
MPNTARHALLIRAIPFLFVFLWSTGFIGAKYALPFIEPFYLLFIRMLWTLAIFFLLAVSLKVTWPSPRQAMQQMVTGFLVHGVYLGGVFAAIKAGLPAGITAIVVGIQPVLTAFLSWKFLGEKLNKIQWLGLAFGLIGVSTIVISTRLTSITQATINHTALWSVLLALLAISLGTLYQKKFGAGVNLVAGSFWQYVSTALLMGILAWSFETRQVVWDRQLIFALMWLVLGLSVSAILLLMYMIREGEAAKVASYFYLVPPVTSLEAWLLFDEALPPIALAAIALTMLGVYLVVKRRSS